MFDHGALWFNTCLFKQGRNFYNTFVKNSFVNMSIHKKDSLNSEQKFIETQGWLPLTFFICLHN